MMNEVQISERFPGQIDFVRNISMGVPRGIDIDLSIVITDQVYNISGNLFYILSAPDDDSYIGVKINENREYQFNLYRGMGFITPFHRLYISTPAGQAGTIVLAYGTESPLLMRVIDNRSSTSLGINSILDELQGDTTPENWGESTVGVAQVQLLAANANRKSYSVCSDPVNNTGVIYLGFDNTVTTAAGGNNWFHALLPGGSYHCDDYRGAVHAISTVAGQVIGVSEV